MNQSTLPPDVRTEMDKRRGQAAGGVGSGARENAASAAARRATEGPETAEAEPGEAIDDSPCSNCKAELEPGWKFCAGCGANVAIQKRPEDALGIEFTDKDLEDYVFKGFVAKELPVIGNFKVMVKSFQSDEAAVVDRWIMNTGDDKVKRSQYYENQLFGIAQTAVGILKFDGSPLPTGEKKKGATKAEQDLADLTAKIAFLTSKGAALSDLLTRRVVLFNRAVTSWIQKKNPIQGS